jgi:hypothetical protein
MTTAIQTDTAAIEKNLLQNPDFISKLAATLQDSQDPDFRLLFTLDELAQHSADYDAGLIKGTPWREERQRRLDAIRN